MIFAIFTSVPWFLPFFCRDFLLSLCIWLVWSLYIWIIVKHQHDSTWIYVVCMFIVDEDVLFWFQTVALPEFLCTDMILITENTLKTVILWGSVGAQCHRMLASWLTMYCVQEWCLCIYFYLCRGQLHRGSGKSAPMPAIQPGQKYHFVPVLFCPGFK